MAQECGFFNAQMVGEEFDRVYLAEQFAAYFAAFIGNGIYGHSMQKLQVLCQDVPNMSIKVLSGEAYINGWWYRNTDTYNIEIPVADGVLSRIDAVVLRWGNTERDIWLQLITGSPSSNPVKPSIRRDADYYDLQLATIEVSAGTVRITQTQIQDTRLDNAVCGLVTGVVDQIDTTDLYNQFESYFKEFKEKYEADYDQWTEEQKQAYIDFTTNSESEYNQWYETHTTAWTQEFTWWFENIKEILSDDAVGNLLSLIEGLRSEIDNHINNNVIHITQDERDTWNNTLQVDGDTADTTVTFSSSDTTNPSAWMNVDTLTTGEKHSSIFSKISKMFRNIRFLYKVLGTVDIASIGDGTVKGAISAINTLANSAKSTANSALSKANTAQNTANNIVANYLPKSNPQFSGTIKGGNFGAYNDMGNVICNYLSAKTGTEGNVAQVRGRRTNSTFLKTWAGRPRKTINGMAEEALTVFGVNGDNMGDFPELSEFGFLFIKDDTGSRSIVLAIKYGTGDMYVRHMFNDNWNTDWIKVH